MKHATLALAAAMFAGALQAQDVGGTPARIHPGEPRIRQEAIGAPMAAESERPRETRPAPVTSAPMPSTPAPIAPAAEPAPVVSAPAPAGTERRTNCYYTGSGLRCTES